MTRQEIETDIAEITRRLNAAINANSETMWTGKEPPEDKRYAHVSEEVKPKVDEYIKTCRKEIAKLKESGDEWELKAWKKLLQKCKSAPVGMILI